MTAARQNRIATAAGGAFALLALVCVAFLIVDHVTALQVQAGETALIEALEKQTGTDMVAAALLHAERERQTATSLLREERQRMLAWLLLIAGGAAIACFRWRASLQHQRLPTLDRLVDERSAPAETPAKASPRNEQTGEREIDLSLVDDWVRRLGGGPEAAIPILQAIQAHYRYLPDEMLQYLCQTSQITAAQIAGTSSFYAQFRRAPVGDRVVRICHGTACHVAGAERISQELRRHLDIAPDQDTDPARRFTLEPVACLGCCSLAPVMMVEEDTAGRLTPVSARQALEALEPLS